MSTASDTVRDFFTRLAAVESSPSSMSVKGTFLDSVEKVLKERDALLAACEALLRDVDAVKYGMGERFHLKWERVEEIAAAIARSRGGE